MIERVRDFLLKWRERTEIDALTDRDLRDLGLSRDQVRTIARMPADSAARMAAMARLFGITAAALTRDHALYHELLCACGSCKDRAACALVLDKGDLARPSDCAFCPNAQSFAALAPA
ncbi:MAG: hypothetical protein RIR62_12 [Pseudomonadota bacterium]|jgi:uncharacterized protein YjiS (DUF1127 family)